MLTPIEYAINFIKLEIPEDILNLAFSKNDEIDKITTLDDKIVREVINQYLRHDLNMSGGSIIHVDLTRCEVITLHEFSEFLIRIPKHLTDNLSIIRPLNMTAKMMYGDQTQVYAGVRANTPINIASKMINALDSQPKMSTTNLELIGDNLVRCREPMGPRLYQLMQVIVENKENFSNIQPQYYDKFKEMALSLTKMVIANKLIVPLDMGYIKGGHEISIVKDIVDGYRDEGEKYKELKQNWLKIAVLNDQHRMHKLIKITCGGHI